MILFKPLRTALEIMKSQGKEIPPDLEEIYNLYQTLSFEHGNSSFPFQLEAEAYLAAHLYNYLKIPANTIIQEEESPKPLPLKQKPTAKDEKQKTKSKKSIDPDKLKQLEQEALMLQELQKRTTF